MLDDQRLLAYIRDELPAEQLREIEELLRTNAESRDQLGRLLEGTQGDQHAPGTVWRQSRLTCPSREEWGSYLLGVLDPHFAAYYRFHLDRVECPFCLANVADLRELLQSPLEQIRDRQERIFRSSLGALKLSAPTDQASGN